MTGADRPPAPYARGDRVELISMPEDPDPIEPGTQGTVTWCSWVSFQRFWQVSVEWDNGRRLMVCIPPDRIRRLSVAP